MNKICKKLAGYVEIICKVMLSIQIVSVMIVVIGRYCFNHTPAWGEELTLFCLVWLSLLGAIIPLYEHKHLRMTSFDSKFSKKFLKISDFSINILIFCFSFGLFFAGLIMTSNSWKTILHGIKISKGFLYLAIPVSTFFYMLMAINRIVDLIKVKNIEEEK